MVATRCPALSSATATCIAIVVLPEPPFSFPTTMTCGAPDGPTGNINGLLYASHNRAGRGGAPRVDAGHETHPWAERFTPPGNFLDFRQALALWPGRGLSRRRI